MTVFRGPRAALTGRFAVLVLRLVLVLRRRFGLRRRLRLLRPRGRGSRERLAALLHLPLRLLDLRAAGPERAGTESAHEGRC